MASKLDRIFRLAAKHYATSFSLWLITAPFLIAGLAFTELPDINGSAAVGKILIAGFVSHLAVGIVLWIGGQTSLHPSRRSSAGWKEVIPVFAVAGVVRGLCIGLVLDFLGVGERNLLTRMNTSVVLIVFTFTVVSHSAQLWREYKYRRNKLLSSISIGERTYVLRGIAAGEYRPLAFGDLENDVLEAREQTKDVLASIRKNILAEKIDPIDIQKAFNVSDVAWRDLSHKAWVAALPNVPRISFFELLKTLASSKPISLIVLSSGPLYGFTRSFGNLPLMVAAFGGLWWWLGVIFIATLTNTYAAKFRSLGVGILLSGIVAIQIVAFVIGLVLLDGAPAQSEILYVSLVSSLAALTLGLPPALERSGQIVLEQLEHRLNNSAIDNLKAQGEMFVLAQRIGIYLHSEVRGDFLRSSLSLREALENGDLEAAEKILDQLDYLVGEINLEHARNDPIKNLILFLENWNGVVEIKHNLEDIDVKTEMQIGVEAIVMEAVNNGVRHGDASWMNIALTENQNFLELQIDSNSKPVEKNSIEGIGTQILDRHAPGNWEWQSIEGLEENQILRLKVSFIQQIEHQK